MRRKAAAETSLVAAKKLRLDDDDDGVDTNVAEDEESRVASEVENILSGRVLDTDISGIPEFEELMSTESEIYFVLVSLAPVRAAIWWWSVLS